MRVVWLWLWWVALAGLPPACGHPTRLEGATYFGGGAPDAAAHDPRNRLTNLLWKAGNTTLASFAYSLNQLGTRTNLSESLTVSSRGYQWTYDTLQRLQSETLTGATTGTPPTI